MERTTVLEVHVQDLDVTRVEPLLRAILQVRSLETYHESDDCDDDVNRERGAGASGTARNNVHELGVIVYNKTFGFAFKDVAHLQLWETAMGTGRGFRTARWRQL
jgi:hypothetical protein